MQQFRTNVFKIKALVNVLATRSSNIYKSFLKDLNLNRSTKMYMCQVGSKHRPLFATGNRGGMSTVEKVVMMLICVSSVNRF